MPLILAAWDVATNQDKKSRFIEHLKWADEHDQIREISAYVRNLKEQQWFHEDEVG